MSELTAILDNMTASRPGFLLQQARLQQGLSVEQVAKQLRLSASKVKLLEQDAYEALPKRVFVVGYLSAYAKLVGLVAEELIKSLARDEQTIEAADWHMSTEVSAMIKKPGRVLSVAISGALGLWIMVGWWWQQQHALSDTEPALTSSISLPSLP